MMLYLDTSALVKLYVDEPMSRELTVVLQCNNPLQHVWLTMSHRDRESAFVDNTEMAEILTNERLIERLQKGSKDAARKKGALIG